MWIFAICSFATFALFVPWNFLAGIILSLSLFVLAVWFAVYIWDHYTEPDVFSKWEIFRMVFTSLCVLVLCTALLYGLGLQVLVRVDPHANDPEWTSFPESCANGTKPLYNCIRVGHGIPHPAESTGPIPFEPYKTTRKNTIDIFSEIIVDRVGCKLITKGEDFAHFRCLSEFLGYPDDLAIRAQCNSDGKALVWIHAQSRIGKWDYNKNDGRIRLISSYISVPADFAGFNMKLNGNPQKCV